MLDETLLTREERAMLALRGCTGNTDTGPSA